MGIQVASVAHSNVTADSLCIAVEALCPIVVKNFQDITGDRTYDVQVCRLYAPFVEKDIRREDLEAENVDDDTFAEHQAEILAATESQPRAQGQNRRCEHRSMTSIIRKKAQADPTHSVYSAWLKGREALFQAQNTPAGRKIVSDFKLGNTKACTAIRDETSIRVTTIAQLLTLGSSAELVFLDEASQISLGQMIAVGTSLPRTRVLALTADTQQLPRPRRTYLSNELEEVLSKSVLDIILQPGILGDDHAFFDTNYHSHEGIVSLFSHYLYDDQVRSARQGQHPISTHFKNLALSGKFRGSYGSRSIMKTHARSKSHRCLHRVRDDKSNIPNES